MSGRVLVNMVFPGDNDKVDGIFLTPGVVAVVDLARRILFNGAVSLTDIDDPGRMREWIRMLSDVSTYGMAHFLPELLTLIIFPH